MRTGDIRKRLSHLVALGIEEAREGGLTGPVQAVILDASVSVSGSGRGRETVRQAELLTDSSEGAVDPQGSEEVQEDGSA